MTAVLEYADFEIHQRVVALRLLAKRAQRLAERGLREHDHAVMGRAYNAAADAMLLALNDGKTEAELMRDLADHLREAK